MNCARALLLLCLAASVDAAPNAVAPSRVHGGTVIVVSKQHATVFLVRNGDQDGPADHYFQVWANPGLALNARYRGADVEFNGTTLSLLVPTDKTAITFVVAGEKPAAIPIPEGFSTTTYEVAGLNHAIGRGAERYTVRAAGSSGRIAANDCTDCEEYGFEDPWGTGAAGSGCTSGGVFSTSCSQSNGSGSCSVTCSSGTYACCMAGDPPSCSCKVYR